MRSSLPEPLPQGPFLVQTALSLGLTRGRLRGRDLARPLWGVRHPDDRCPTFADDLRAASTLVDPDEVYCRETAARLLHLPLPLPWRPTEGIHVCGPTSGSRLRRKGVTAHRGLEVRATTTCGEYACTDAVTTWADLSDTLSVDDLIVLGDAVAHWRRGIPLVELESAAASRAGRRGVVKLRAALPQIRQRSDSPMETLGRLLFVRAGLPEPEQNVPVTDAAGGWLGTGDYVWKARRVMAEFDGDHHRVDRRQWQIDVARRETIQDHGWHYVQLTGDAITHPLQIPRTLERLAGLLGVTV